MSRRQADIDQYRPMMQRHHRDEVVTNISARASATATATEMLPMPAFNR